MNISELRPLDDRPYLHDEHHGGGINPAAGTMAMPAMMVLMMSMCLGAVLLFTFIPAVGLTAGLVLAAAVAAVMLFACGRMMRHRH